MTMKAIGYMLGSVAMYLTYLHLKRTTIDELRGANNTQNHELYLAGGALRPYVAVGLFALSYALVKR